MKTTLIILGMVVALFCLCIIVPSMCYTHATEEVIIEETVEMETLETVPIVTEPIIEETKIEPKETTAPTEETQPEEVEEVEEPKNIQTPIYIAPKEEVVETKPVEPVTPEETIAPVEPAPVEPEIETEVADDFEEQWSEAAVYLAKTVWGEARGTSLEGQEKVVWCVLNRVDDSRFPDDIVSVITQQNQFHGYSSDYPCTDEMYDLSLEVIKKWQDEKNGEEVDRILDPEYVYFSADSSGLGNDFRTHW